MIPALVIAASNRAVTNDENQEYSNVRKSAFVILAFTLASISIFPSRLASQQAAMETAVNRPGSDYKDFELASAEPKLCMAACLKESECKSWTYVKPGVQGEKAHCWLKNEVPDPDPNEDCVSGVKK